jgi:hypothetical protein
VTLLESEYLRAVADAELRWVSSVMDDLNTGALRWSQNARDNGLGSRGCPYRASDDLAPVAPSPARGLSFLSRPPSINLLLNSVWYRPTSANFGVLKVPLNPVIETGTFTEAVLIVPFFVERWGHNPVSLVEQQVHHAKPRVTLTPAGRHALWSTRLNALTRPRSCRRSR